MIKVSVISVFDGVEFLDVEVEEFTEAAVRRAFRSLPQFTSDEGFDMLGELMASGPSTMTFQFWGGPSIPVAWTIVSVG